MSSIKYILIVHFCLFNVSLSLGQSFKGNDHLDDVNRSALKLFETKDTTKILDFIFKDTLGRDVRVSDFKGKVVLIDIWYSGCGACIHINNGLKKVHEVLKNEKIVFLSISIDTNKKLWMSSITQSALPSKMNPWASKYYPAPGTIILYTGGTGSKNDFIKKYVPQNLYPQMLLIDEFGRLLSNKPPRPDYEPEKLVDYIYKTALKK